MNEGGQLRWLQAVRDLLDRAHLCTPQDVPGALNASLAPLGVRARIWLIDYEQTGLWPLPEPGRDTPEQIPVDGSPAGHAFTRVASMPAGEADRWWVPMVDGTDRLGVIEFEVPGGPAADVPDFVRHCEVVAGLAGHLIAATTLRGDHIDRVRRTRPMSTAAELLWRLLPPLTSSSERIVMSAVLQPCYEVGGDGFDYALDGPTARIVVLDAAGRGLPAGLACAVVLAALRATRRAGRDLSEQARVADAALEEQFPDTRFATAVLAELDVETGRLRYINAGHPPPLVLRAGRVVGELDRGRRLPLGVADGSAEVAEEVLEPGDRLLLYTDGVTEARTSDGDRFGRTRLVDLAERHEAAGLPAPETLRRLAHAVIRHQPGTPADDATLMLVHWYTPAALNTVPGAGQRRNDEGSSA